MLLWSEPHEWGHPFTAYVKTQTSASNSLLVVITSKNFYTLAKFIYFYLKKKKIKRKNKKLVCFGFC